MDSGYRFGEFTLDFRTMTLSRYGATIELRPKAYDTLRVLLERAGNVVSKDELVAEVWPDVTVNDDALSQCVRDVRRSLGDDDKDMIRTVAKRGYIFDADVAPLLDDHPTPAPSHSYLGRLAAGVVAALALLATAFWFSQIYPPDDRQITVAVLPFATLGPDEGDDWLGEGIAEDIMTELSRFTNLGVIARNSAFRYRDIADSPQSLGEELGAEYLLQGSVRRIGNHIRVATQLVESSGGSNVWAERYDEPYAEVSTLPREVAGAIAGRLAANIFSDAAASAANGSGSASAFEATLRARHAYYAFSRDAAYDSLKWSDRAIQLDPSSAQAWEYRARILVQFFVQPYDDRRGDRTVLENALEAAREAVRLDPQSSSAAATLGDVYTWSGDHDTGLQHLYRAVELNPNNSSAQKRLADGLGRAGQHADSLAAWESAMRLDPIKVPLNYALMGRSHLMLGDYKLALEMTGDCIELTPKMMPCHIFHAMAAGASGRDDAARGSVQTIQSIAPGFNVSDWLKIVGYRDEPTITRLNELAVAAGLPP